jgi:hypothetical protein
MLSLVRRTAVAAVVVSASLAAYAPGESQAVPQFSRAAWDAALGAGLIGADVDLPGQVPDLGILNAGDLLNMPSGNTMFFDFALEGRQLGTTWATWSAGIPASPRILYTQGQDVVEVFFNGPIMDFGLEMQPADMTNSYDMSITLSDATVITQADVNGTGGAMFFGWTNQAVTGFIMTCNDDNNGPCDFGIARMVQGIPEANEVAEPASLALFGFGLAGLAFARRRRTA